MNKKRFTFLLLFVVAMVVFGTCIGGNSILLYLDIPSLVLVPILPYIIASFIYPFNEQRKFNREIFAVNRPGDKQELLNAVNFYKLLRILTIFSAVFGTLIGFIGILGAFSSIENNDTFAQNFGVLSICSFYGIVYLIAIVEPLGAAAKKRLNE